MPHNIRLRRGDGSKSNHLPVLKCNLHELVRWSGTQNAKSFAKTRNFQAILFGGVVYGNNIGAQIFLFGINRSVDQDSRHISRHSDTVLEQKWDAKCQVAREHQTLSSNCVCLSSLLEQYWCPDFFVWSVIEFWSFSGRIFEPHGCWWFVSAIVYRRSS